MNVKNLLLVSAFFPPSVGGPATFVSHIGPEFVNQGYTVVYANLEAYKNAPRLKQKLFFIRDLWKKIAHIDLVIVCDTWSVLIPTVFVCLVRRKKYILRIGGDFLWETYVSRTKEHRKLSSFYTPVPKHSFKEKIIYLMTRFCLKYAHAVIFNTPWQRAIWQIPYRLQKEKTFIVENAFFTGLAQYTWKPGMQRIIRCPVRASEFKNEANLKKVWNTISQKYPDAILLSDYIHPNERLEVLSKSYAVIQPSISDVGPNLICEAVSSGCPFICTDDTGIRSLVPDDIGMYIDTKNESGIQTALEKMLDLDFHAEQVKKIAGFKMVRTYAVLAQEYQNIWKML